MWVFLNAADPLMSFKVNTTKAFSLNRFNELLSHRKEKGISEEATDDAPGESWC